MNGSELPEKIEITNITYEDVLLCIEKGAKLITANDPVPLMKVLGRMQ